MPRNEFVRIERLEVIFEVRYSRRARRCVDNDSASACR